VGVIRWLRSALQGEVSAGEVEARRAAGTFAYSLAEEADTDGSPLFRVCAWNAFALQTIADKLIEADSAADPETEGYVPQSTLRYMSACVDLVPDWIRWARIAQSDAGARVASPLPARLPLWQRDEPTRRSELQGLQAAYEALQARVETALTEASAPELRRVAAEMRSAADYAAAIGRRDAGPVERGEARVYLLAALQHAFTLGQLLAMPTLAEIERVREDRDAGLPLGRHASWLQIGPGWPVLDSDGETVGLVHRVCGDRDTGRFEGVDVSQGLGRAGLHVPAETIAEIGAGQIRLSVATAALS
jgi:hypothetical protein